MLIKVELGCVVSRLLANIPGPVKLIRRFCGQGRVRSAAGSNVHGPPMPPFQSQVPGGTPFSEPQPSLAIRNPIPSWKVGPPGVAILFRVKFGPSKTSFTTSSATVETGQLAPASEEPVPVVHSSVNSLQAGVVAGSPDGPPTSPEWTRHSEVAKGVLSAKLD